MTKCKDIDRSQKVVMIYSDCDVVCRCKPDTIRMSENGTYIINYNELINGVGEVLEARFKEK